MRLFSRVVAMVVAGALLAGPALAQSHRGSSGTSPSPMTLSPGVNSSMTRGIPGTLGGRPLDSGASATGAIGNPSTLGTSTTGSTGLLGGSVFGGSTGAAR